MTTLREALQGVYDRHGELTAQLVLDAARADEGGALHGHIFHVPEGEAAERYYLDRARALIRTFKVKRVTPQGEVVTTRQWTSLPTPTGQAYKDTEEVVSDDFTRTLALQQLERELNALRRRFGDLREFADLVRRDLLGEAS